MVYSLASFKLLGMWTRIGWVADASMSVTSTDAVSSGSFVVLGLYMLSKMSKTMVLSVVLPLQLIGIVEPATRTEFGKGEDKLIE